MLDLEPRIRAIVNQIVDEKLSQIQSDPLDALWTTEEAAKFLKLSKSHMNAMRSRSDLDGPNFFKLGGRVVYRKSDVIKWVANRRSAG